MAVTSIFPTPEPRLSLEEFAAKLRMKPTKGELALLEPLTERGFLFQCPIKPYVADFALLDLKLILEVDGYSHVGKEQSDYNRDSAFADSGWKIFRVPEDTAIKHTANVLLGIDAYLEFRRKVVEVFAIEGLDDACVYRFAKRKAELSTRQMLKALDRLGLDKANLLNALAPHEK